MGIRESLISWAAVNSGLPAIWQNQNVQRPAMPYVTLHIVSRTDLGATASYGDLSTGGTLGTQTSSRTVTYSVNVQVFSANVDDAFSRAESLRASLDKRSVLDTLIAAHIGVLSVGSIQDITAIVGSGYESRATFDTIVASIVDTVDNLQWIATTSTEGEVLT